MQNAFGVSGSESSTELARHLDSFVLRQTPDPAKQGRQIFTVHVLHRKESLPIDFTDVVYAADVGMRDTARDPDFILETFEQAFIAQRFVGQELHRDGLAQGRHDFNFVASQLGLSSRSLQRELAVSGTTFSRIRDDVRLEVATSLLGGSDLSIGEIAYRLGYSEIAGLLMLPVNTVRSRLFRSRMALKSHLEPSQCR